MAQMKCLVLFNNISPLSAQLLCLIASVNIVEDSELGSKHECEVTDFDIAKVEGKQEFMVEDHVTDPFVVRPSSKTRN